MERRDGFAVATVPGGWKPGTLEAGDKITVVIHPMRDGTKGGLFVSAVGADGKPIGTST